MHNCVIHGVYEPVLGCVGCPKCRSSEFYPQFKRCPVHGEYLASGECWGCKEATKAAPEVVSAAMLVAPADPATGRPWINHCPRHYVHFGFDPTCPGCQQKAREGGLTPEEITELCITSPAAPNKEIDAARPPYAEPPPVATSRGRCRECGKPSDEWTGSQTGTCTECIKLFNNDPRQPGLDPKAAAGAAKPPLWLIPPAGNEEQAKAFQDGINAGYGPWNWRETKVLRSVYLSAMKRHIDKILDGEDIDPRSGAHHLGHVMANCAIILDAARHGTLVIDGEEKGV